MNTISLGGISIKAILWGVLAYFLNAILMWLLLQALFFALFMMGINLGPLASRTAALSTIGGQLFPLPDGYLDASGLEHRRRSVRTGSGVSLDSQ